MDIPSFRHGRLRYSAIQHGPITLTCKGTWRHMFICLRPPGQTSEKVRGALVHKRGVENTNITGCISSLETLFNTSKDDIQGLVSLQLFGPCTVFSNESSIESRSKKRAHYWSVTIIFCGSPTLFYPGSIDAGEMTDLLIELFKTSEDSSLSR